MLVINRESALEYKHINFEVIETIMIQIWS